MAVTADKTELDGVKATTKTLPHDIVLMIIEELDIDSFLQFRLTCRAYYDLISSHMLSLTPAVARTTFPGQSQMLKTAQSNDAQRSLGSLRWLKWLRYEQLAAIIVEQKHPWGITAEDPRGDDIRSAIASGWHLMAHLAKIADEVSHLPREAMPQRLTSSDEPAKGSSAQSEEEKSLEQQRELEICFRWMKFIEGRAFPELKVLDHLVTIIIHDIFDVPRTRAYDPLLPLEYDCIAWAMTCVFKRGPQAFWESWWNRSEHSQCLPAAEHRAGPIAHHIQDTWLVLGAAVPAWRLDAVRVLRHQVRGIEKHIGPIMTASLPREQIGRWFSRRRWRYTLSDLVPPSMRYHREKPGSMATFETVTFKQKINWELLGYVQPPGLDMSEDGIRRRRRQGCGHRTAHRELPLLSQDFAQLFHEWEQEWLRSCGSDDWQNDGDVEDSNV